MARVVLIENPEELDELTEGEMRRWWSNRCRAHRKNGETYFEVGSPNHFRVYEGIKRFASFGIKARAANRCIA